jgi:hypothetical protein
MCEFSNNQDLKLMSYPYFSSGHPDSSSALPHKRVLRFEIEYS